MFDNIDHSFLMKAVRHHTNCSWVLLYIERWLTAPVQQNDGVLRPRTKGTPQGGVFRLYWRISCTTASIAG